MQISITLARVAAKLHATKLCHKKLDTSDSYLKQKLCTKCNDIKAEINSHNMQSGMKYNTILFRLCTDNVVPLRRYGKQIQKNYHQTFTHVPYIVKKDRFGWRTFAVPGPQLWNYRVSTNLTEQISRRLQEGFQEKSRTVCIASACYVMYRIYYI